MVRGSPPHTWRKLALTGALVFCNRITSTYVEKTNLPPFERKSLKDHLHIRGENVAILALRSATIGSPPHTWRKPSQQVSHLRAFRITSTYVEKTLYMYKMWQLL